MITKFDIYQYWENKSVTRSYKIKSYDECIEDDKAIPIVEFSDSICCWACDIPSLIFDNEISEFKSLKEEWNNDKCLQKSHILAKSLGGNEEAENMFLLCPICHAESPDTINPENFFAWIYYKRNNENYTQIIERELEKAIKIKNVNYKIVEDYFSDCNYYKMMTIRKKIIKSSTLHGSFVSMSSKMMALLDEIIRDKY